MAKWTSSLFSDIRNKLGDQVVFSNWKGRGYMRQYVKPANPNTLKQQAVRDATKKIIKRFQEVITSENEKGVWNKLALPLAISGYNLFVKYAKKSQIKCPATASAGSDVSITYTLGFPAGEAGIYRYDGTNYTDITPAGGLVSGTDQTITDTAVPTGEYVYFIAYKKALIDGDTSPQSYQTITAYSPNYDTGVADEAKITVS
jgi:hypothetical protein